jgi:EAL domain-containing protein (putative c-di-GMP-specific phosphodiesterase class I)
MYRAKELGRNNYQLYDPKMSAPTAQSLSLMSDLRKALDRGEFVVYYQPQIHVKTGELIGVEALLRWQHPQRGMISPAQFIPLAEETGLIVPIGEWVLRTACAQVKAWAEAGFPEMRVAVNLSARQFMRDDLVEVVERVLRDTGLKPHLLELEITESMTMHNVERAIQILHGLKNLGVMISLDDFGTGYSSLSYLKHFPIHMLKIDQSFVRDITVDPDDAAIVNSIIALAHALQLNVIAEGVETEEQLAYLVEQGCFEMQGYLFSPPLPVQSLENLIRFVQKQEQPLP